MVQSLQNQKGLGQSKMQPSLYMVSAGLENKKCDIFDMVHYVPISQFMHNIKHSSSS